MIRILGAITGSALALATLLVVIGIPQFKTVGSASEHAIVTLPLPTTPVERSDTEQDDVVADSAPGPSTAGPVDAPLDTDVAATEPSRERTVAAMPPGAVSELADMQGDAPDFAASPAPGPAQPVLDSPQSWYAFWSPFRSELAANGFVAQLQSVTGLDYRVVRVKPGVYEVAFAYESDDDIPAKLTQITAATGLELPR